MDRYYPIVLKKRRGNQRSLEAYFKHSGSYAAAQRLAQKRFSRDKDFELARISPSYKSEGSRRKSLPVFTE